MTRRFFRSHSDAQQELRGRAELLLRHSVAAAPPCAVSQNCILQAAGKFERLGTRPTRCRLQIGDTAQHSEAATTRWGERPREPLVARQSLAPPTEIFANRDDFRRYW